MTSRTNTTLTRLTRKKKPFLHQFICLIGTICGTSRTLETFQGLKCKISEVEHETETETETRDAEETRLRRSKRFDRNLHNWT